METSHNTPFTDVSRYEIRLLDQPIAHHIKSSSFVTLICRLWRGTPPTVAEERMLNALLVSTILHTNESPSIRAATAIADSGGSITDALAGTFMTMKSKHGGATGAFAKSLQKSVHLHDSPEATAHFIIAEFEKTGSRVPGFGHAIHPIDPRTVALIELSHETGVYGKHTQVAELIATELSNGRSKPLSLNVTGALSALLSDLHFHWEIVPAFFALSRAVGAAALIQSSSQRDAKAHTA